MSSVLNGSSLHQAANSAIRNQVNALSYNLNKLGDIVNKLIDVVREIAVKTDVSMDIFDASGNESQQGRVQQQTSAPPSSRTTTTNAIAPTNAFDNGPSLSGLRRRY
jgi:hypothetical protein